MRTSTLLCAATLLLSAGAVRAEDSHRQLGAHVHGHGRLEISIEGKRVTLEFEAPGADIVGFEHAATSPEQKAALEKAKGTLANPLALFKIPDAAGCRVTAAKVEIESEDHDDHHDAHHAGAAGEHSGFDVDYALDCAAPEAITSITFDYFAAFPNSKALTVDVTTAKGQTSQEVTRDKPRMDLGGLM